MNVIGNVIWLLRAARISLSAMFVLLLIQTASAQTPPTVDDASVNGSTLTISFSEEFTSTSTAVASDFAVTLGGDSQTVVLATVAGSDITLILELAVPDPDCTDSSIAVDFTPLSSMLVGVNGASVEPFANLDVANVTDAAPQILSLDTDATGRTVHVTFCEAIADVSYQWSDFSAFTLSVNGDRRAVNDLLRRADSPHRLEILIGRSNAIQEGDMVTLAFDQSKADDNFPLQDLDQGAKLVASWSARTVTNRVDGPPTLAAVSSLYEHITMTFSEPLDEESVPDPDAFSIGGAAHLPTIVDVSISNDTVTLTLDGILNNRNATMYSISYYEPSINPLRQADGAHNVTDIYSETFQSSTPNERPTIVTASVDAAQLLITFDLPLGQVAPPSAFSVTGENGITVTDSAVSGSILTLTLSPPVSGGATITVSYVVPHDPPRLSGRNHRDVDAFSNYAVTNDTALPVPVFSKASTSGDGRTLSIDFSLPLDSSSDGHPPATAFALSGTDAAIFTVSVAGSSVTLTLNPIADYGEAISVSYTPPTNKTAPRLHAQNGKEVAAFSGRPVTNGTDGKPRPLHATLEGDTIIVYFDRTLDDQSVPAATAWTISGATAVPSSITINDNNVGIRLSTNLTHLDLITLSYNMPSAMPLKRLGSSQLVDSFSDMAVTNNTEDPTPRFRSASVDAAGRLLTINMSHGLLPTPAGIPNISTFGLSGATTAVIQLIAIDGPTVDLTLDPAVDVNEMIRISYHPPSDSSAASLRSADGQWKTRAWINQVVSNHTDGVPRFLTGEANADAVTLQFDRALDDTSVPATTEFTITPKTISVESVHISDTTVRLTLSQTLAYDDHVTVSYSATGSVKLKRDGLSIDAAAFSAVPVTNRTPQPLVSAATGDARSVTVDFTIDLADTSIPAGSAFTLSPEPQSIDSVTVDKSTVRLTLDRPLEESASYTLTYTQPSLMPLISTDGLVIPSFSHALTNRTDVAPEVKSVKGDLQTITLTFDQALAPNAVIDVSTFSVTGGDAVDVTALTIDDHTISLTISRALFEEEMATITYTMPAQGGIGDVSGNRTESFVLDIDNVTDTAPVPTSGYVSGDTITILLDQELYADPRFDGEDGYPTEHFTLSDVDAQIDFVYVSNGGEGGVGKIEITLSRAIAEGEDLSITYFPNSGTIRIRDDDPGQHRAQINGYMLRNRNDHPPTPSVSVVDGATLHITFDQPLDPNSQPPTSAFMLSNDGPAVEAISIADSTLALSLVSTVIEDETYTVTYTPPSSGQLRDLTGNLALGFTRPLDNSTDYAPYPTLVKTDTNGHEILLRFDQRLDPSISLDPSWFSLDPAAEFHSVVLDPNVPEGTQLRLILDSSIAIQEGATVSLRYHAPDGGGLRDDDAGNLVSSFTATVENVVDVAPVVSQIAVVGIKLEITFDQDLDPSQVPPANCEQLEPFIESLDCDDHPEISWFDVFRREGLSAAALEIASVSVSGSTAMLSLSKPVTPDDSILVKYSPESLQGGRWNLRDRSTPPHQVESFDAMEANNLTPASAIGASFDRSRANVVEIQFDGALSDSAPVDPTSISVSVGGRVVQVSSTDVSGSTLAGHLADDVPECVSISVAHAETNPRLLDVRGRAVGAFTFDVANLIDPAWALECAHSDYGGVVLQFSDSAPKRQEYEWEVRVDGDERELAVEAVEGVVRLLPTPSICAGERVEIEYADEDGAIPGDRLTLSRTFSPVAPCVMSAEAVGPVLTVTFDGELDPVMPDASDFEISGAEIASIAAIDGNALEIQLAGPGLLAGQETELRYLGTSLRGADLTIGEFAIKIVDRTASPEFESAFAVGSAMFLKFDQPLLARNVPGSLFTLAGPGVEQLVDSVSINGSSAYLELSDPLLDEPELIAVVYSAASRGGLAGLTGARVDDSVFIVQNYTETRPAVVSATADSLAIQVTFNQSIDGRDLLPNDFLVMAGHRSIQVKSLDWSRDGVRIALTERVTSLDAVLLRYRPQAGRAVRDLSNLELDAFDLWVDNQTKGPRSVAVRIEDAKLRASGAGTTLARELARGFAADRRIGAALAVGDGRTRLIGEGLTATVEAERIADTEVRIEIARIDGPTKMLRELASTPESCWSALSSAEVSAWWIGETDRPGVPSDIGVPLTIDGAFEASPTSSLCVLNLLTGVWSRYPQGGLLRSPALLLHRESESSSGWR